MPTRRFLRRSIRLAGAAVSVVSAPSQNARTATTFRRLLLMDQAHKLEVAERIRLLRERSPYSQQVIADRLDIKLRSYQRIEEQGIESWERLEELAEIHNSYARLEEWPDVPEPVTAHWLYSGELAPKRNGADPLAQMQEQLHRLEAKLDALLPGAAVGAVAEAAEVERGAATRSGRRRTSKRGRQAG